jgi:hypothetical protein
MQDRRIERIMDLALLGATNARGCPACGRKFNLGDTVVLACGHWEGGAQYVHRDEAVFDVQSGGYVERTCLADR